jgi:DNA polymerase epsilon subunit 1
MYPNIILTNRLQPNAMVNDSTCAACDFNQEKNNCKRKMDWVWRGDYNPASKGEYDRARDQLSRERFDGGVGFHELPESEQADHVATRLKQYAKKAYNRTKITEEVTRNDTICMRENDFYVNTVRDFRDKRYELKKLTKVWGGKVKKATDAMSKKEAEDKALVYDSLQVAHKCILNSFYGYVMRKGARWRSMEMAGIVTKTGADLITQARILVEQIGRPLELDTDGIWCILPQSFPDVFYFKTDSGSTLKLEYPCIMLNADVHNNFTNHQYQTLKDPRKRTYETRSECSIFFEVDGPYRCMVIPSSTEEGKLLKKRYAVFNFDGSLAELKGFELKRRGELELIKTFQSQVFERFLNGESLIECYASVAEIANHWLDVLDTQGESLETDELFDLISENRNMSRQLEDYGDQKGTSQTTARRIGEFLGAEVIKDKGLNCKFIIAERPHGAQVTERAIPTAIFKAEPAVMNHFLRKWLKSPQMEDDDFDLRNILDWDYYRNRLGKTIQKIITIPAALQKVPNPVPRLPHPEWLQRTVRRLNDRYQQKSITSMFSLASNIISKKKADPPAIKDIEDTFGSQDRGSTRPIVHSRRRNKERVDHSDKQDNNSIHAVDVENVQLSAETFQSWLARKKGIWNFKERRKRSKRERTSSKAKSITSVVSDASSKKQRKAVGSMEGFIRDAAQSLAEHEWHVLEVRDSSSSDAGSSSGELIFWVILSNGSLQRVIITMPRTIYVNCKEEVAEISSLSLKIRKVEKHLPRNKAAANLYEVTMPEYTFRSSKWLDHFRSRKKEILIESFYELGTTQTLRSLLRTGCVCRVDSSSIGKSGKYALSDLKLVEQPASGQYLNPSLSFRKIFLYERLHTRSHTGLIVVFVMDASSAVISQEKVDLTSQCFIWAVTPGGEKAQRNISRKICETIFSELLQAMQQHTLDDTESKYGTLSPDSEISVGSLAFVGNEEKAFKGAQDLLNTYSQGNNGPTLLLINSTKSMLQIRKRVPGCNSYPIVQLPSPPGVDNSASIQPLDWEKESVQICFEAYLYMGAESFDKHVNHARYAKVPIGNLGTDAIITSYDVMLARVLQKNRALMWTSSKPGCPDVGLSSLSLAPGASILGLMHSHSNEIDSNDIWGDENESTSPVVAYPGAYRSICVEIDIHYLAIAALSDSRSNSTGAAGIFGADGTMANSNATLGDEMATAISLPLLRSLVQHWLHDASELGNPIADKLLGHVYRLINSPGATLNDPALHRVVVSLMKVTFYQLLGEFQRLGSTIISATFNRIIIATNKTSLSEAMEYTDFVIATIKKRLVSSDNSADFARLSLVRNNFYAHYIFLDEHNYGGLLFENRQPEDDDEAQWAFNINVPSEEGRTESITIVPTVQSGWNIAHYLASEIAQENFRIVISRFSKDIFRKQGTVRKKALKEDSESNSCTKNGEDSADEPTKSPREQLLNFKKKLISRQFAKYLTDCVGDIKKDAGGPESFPQLPGSYLNLQSPVLEFIKSVIIILELDPDVNTEVQQLKKSLLTQIGVQEYSSQAKWENPCASFVLPDVFCAECQECRDIDLCILPSVDEDQINTWTCDDCGTAYNAQSIERRLVDVIQRKCLRYQMQDLRCTRTGRVSTRILSMQSETSQKLKLDISRDEVTSQLQILKNLAVHYELEWLLETTRGLMQTL